jgi:maltooligosyltrehalose trehalohydrolase
VRPDPASRSQPDGVHGLSEVVAPERFPWRDSDWGGVRLSSLILYELHVGTFSPAGTFDGVARRLSRLSELGVSAIELMPVAQFPGARNWGYDGVYPFAVQTTYGGIGGLQRLSNVCHERGLGLFVDVVYNHLGPEGNYLGEFGPYFTDVYRTPWGAAMNFDGAGSDEVRRYFLESATSLVESAHLDGLRVDAVHAIIDPTAKPFLAELTEAVRDVSRRTGRTCWTVAESALNDPRVVAGVAEGGLGFDAVWNDDFHHALHVSLTGERQRYFADYEGPADMYRVLTDGYALAGRFSPFRGRRHGRLATGVPAHAFVVFDQNHDQVGNRPHGERLSRLIGFEAQKLAAGLLLLSPYLPMLFMGEEYGEGAPFLYFTDHGDRALVRAVREGRRAEFAAAAGGREPPDPQARMTFERSRIDPARREGGRAHRLYELYRTLIALRAEYVPARRLGPAEVGADPRDPTLLWIRRTERYPRPSLALFHMGAREWEGTFPSVKRPLELRIASAGTEWGGPGESAPKRLPAGPGTSVHLAPWSFLFYTATSSA